MADRPMPEPQPHPRDIVMRIRGARALFAKDGVMALAHTVWRDSEAEIERLRDLLQWDRAALEAIEKEMRLHTFVCTKCGHSFRDEPQRKGRICPTPCGYYAMDAGGHEKWAEIIRAVLEGRSRGTDTQEALKREPALPEVAHAEAEEDGRAGDAAAEPGLPARPHRHREEEIARRASPLPTEILAALVCADHCLQDWETRNHQLGQKREAEQCRAHRATLFAYQDRLRAQAKIYRTPDLVAAMRIVMEVADVQVNKEGGWSRSSPFFKAGAIVRAFLMDSAALYAGLPDIDWRAEFDKYIARQSERELAAFRRGFEACARGDWPQHRAALAE